MLRAIVDAANSKMYNVREFCEVYSAPQGQIKSPAEEEKTQDTFISVRYIAGQDTID